MKPNLFYILSTIAAIVLGGSTFSCGRQDKYDLDDAMLQRLDSVITVKDEIIARKQKHIDRIRKSLYDAHTPAERYRVYDELYNQYYTFNFDSAAVYARLKMKEAEAIGDRRLCQLSALHRARVNMLLGSDSFVNDSLEYVGIVPESIDSLDKSVQLAYYNLVANRQETSGKLDFHIYQRIKSLLDTGSNDWTFARINELRGMGRYDEALELLQSRHRQMDSTIHTRAISRFIEGQLQLQLGDSAKATDNFVISSYSDLMTPVRDHKSLYELAMMLLKHGDIDRAYRYINAAVIDGNAAHVASNTAAMNQIIPDIMAARERQNQERKRSQTGIISAITLLLIILGGILYYALASRSKLNRANRKLRELNDKLEASNSVKDAYLVQYFDLCSYFLSALEQFRTNVSAALRTKGTTGVERLLAKADDDRELKRFYANFDDTFLKLFPDFVSKFNALVNKENQLSLNRDGGMSNELRTFALIRLGINDSEQIARFLRRSISTVYNYRVKMRNAAICNREDFEKKVANL